MPRSYSENPNSTLPDDQAEKTKLPNKKRAKKKKAGPSSPAEDAAFSIQDLQACIGYQFSDSFLLQHAITHRSFSQEVSPPEPDNERLEFLGDAVLQLVVTKRLWSEMHGATEGELTRRRSEMVNGRALAKLARQMDLSDYLRLGRGEIKTGGKNKSSILAGALEALVGAVYLDAGYMECADWIEGWLWHERNNVGSDEHADFKSILQERLQRKNQRLPVYRVIKETGPEHEKTFEVEVRHGKKVLGTGKGANKKAAEQAAARASLSAMAKAKSAHGAK